MVALLVLFTILVFLTVDYFVQKREATVAATARATSPVAARRSVRGAPQIRYRTPRGVFFSPGHTWLFLEESGAVRLGINEFAQSIIGRIDSVRTRAAGETISKHEVILELRHDGRTVGLRSPIDGVIEAVNTELLRRRDFRGTEPFSAAWFYRIGPKNASDEFHNLLLGDAAKEWLSREVQRLKVILSTIVPRDPVLGETLQDGGLPAWGLIDYLSEMEWQQLKERMFE